MALEGVKFSIPEILKKIGNKDEVLDENEIDLFATECRKYKNLTNAERQSIFNIVQAAMCDKNKQASDDTIWDIINGTHTQI